MNVIYTLRSEKQVDNKVGTSNNREDSSTEQFYEQPTLHTHAPDFDSTPSSASTTPRASFPNRLRSNK